MADLKEMRAKRTAKAQELRTLLDENPGDKWTAALNDKYDAGIREMDDLDAQIERYQAILDRTANDRDTEAVRAAVDRAERDGTITADALFAKWCRRGDNGITAEEWAEVRATMSTTTPAEGGYTVQSEVAKSVVDALKAFGGMRQVATVFATEQGNPLNFPTSDGTSEVGEILAENESATDQDITFGTVPLPVYKFSSKVVTVPIELLQDSNVDIESFVRSRIVTRLGRAQNNYFTTGTGTGQPKGVIAAATVGKTGTTGQTTSVIYDDLVDLEFSIDPAYRELGNCRWMMNNTTLRELRKLKDENKRPIWMPGDAEGVTGGMPATILGYPYSYNQSMASMAANAKSIAFGDFSFYHIRDVMAVTFHRFTDSAYAKKGQVGFLAFMRTGGNLVDVGGAVKVYQNSAT